MDFQTAHDAWLNHHLRSRRGESRRKLEEGYKVAQRAFIEKVWWPAVGNFNNLTPEYEVRDFADKQRFLDLAYIQGHSRFCVEVDGFGPHWRGISRWQFADQLNRQNHLIADEWKIYRFAYDEVVERPRGCQQFIQQVLGKIACALENNSDSITSFTLLEKEIVRYLREKQNPYITPTIIVKEFQVSKKAAYRTLYKLCKIQIIAPVDPSKRRQHKYRLHTSIKN